MNHTKKLTRAGVFCLLMTIVVVSADAQTSGTSKNPPPAKGLTDLGFIFSTDGILSGFESYGSGLGGKFGWGKFFLRGGLDFFVDKESQSSSLNVGAAGEYHLAPGPVSPYIGLLTQVGYMKAGTLTSAVPFSVGAIAGAEIYVFDFLSLFVEYCIALDCELTTDLQTSQTTFNYTLDTRMGNNSRLGIVVYFKRAKVKSLFTRNP